jgi:RNA polymerase sigma factor (sigma-70 family)
VDVARMSRMVQHFCQALEVSLLGDLSDGQLLRRFVAQREEAAFAQLVCRHGGMVLGVCRRVLGNPHDAEDAFQATFLVLARKAGSIRQHQALSGWLFAVAHRLALRLRAEDSRRRTHENQAALSRPEALADLSASDLRAVLDEELSRLPDKYRTAVALCYLQEKTQEEAARCLGCTVGTVNGQLKRARELLRVRLGRRGLGLPAAGLAFLAAEAASAAPRRLVEAVARAALLVTPLATWKGTLTGLLVLLAMAAGAGGLVPWLSWKEVIPPPANPAPLAARQPHALEPLPVRPWAELRHESVPVFLAASPNGRLLAAAGEDGRIKVWDPVQGTLVTQLRAFEPTDLPDPELGHSARRVRLAFSGLRFPDNQTLAAGLTSHAGDAAEVILWDAATSRERGRFPTGRGFAFSADSTTLATERNGDLVVWTVATGKVATRIKGADKLHALALGPNGRTAVSGEETGVIQLWDLASGKPVQRFQVRPAGPIPGPQDGLVLSPDGRLAAPGGSWAGSLPIWETSTGLELRTLAVSSGLVYSVTLSADGRRLAAVTRDSSIRVIEVATGKTIQAIAEAHGTAGITTLAFTADGKTILSGGTDGTICCWPLP